MAQIQSLAVPVHKLPSPQAQPAPAGKNAPLTFADPIAVTLSPANSGLWSAWDENTDRWRLDLHSPGARSINLHFDKFVLPVGATLRLYAPSAQAAGLSLSATDNKSHGAYWTPQISGDALRLDLTLPKSLKRQVALQIADVNVGW